MREKLIESLTYLLECELAGDCSVMAEDWADHLIANGVVVSKMETTTKWIPVTERLPDFEGCLLCMRKAFVGDKIRYQDILYYDEDGFRMEFEDTPIPIESVTHWMPLPDPPKDGE